MKTTKQTLIDTGIFCTCKTCMRNMEPIIEAMEEYAAQFKTEPPSDEEIIKIAKKEIAYNKHLALTGKQMANTVLYFWMNGAKKMRDLWIKSQPKHPEK